MSGSAISCASIRWSSCCARRAPERAGRHGRQHAVRAARRLHAGRAQGDRRRPAARAARPRAPAQLAGAIARRRVTARRLIMSRKWKAALAPFLAGIPLRTGFVGEMRFGLHQRYALRRARAAAHDRPDGRAGAAEGRGAAGGMAAARIDGAGATRSSAGARSAGSRRTPGRSSRCRPARSAKARPGRSRHYAALARALANDGASVWVLGGPSETPIARADRRAGRRARARPHRQRSAQRHSRARRRRCCRSPTIPA